MQVNNGFYQPACDSGSLPGRFKSLLVRRSYQFSIHLSVAGLNVLAGIIALAEENSYIYAYFRDLLYRSNKVAEFVLFNNSCFKSGQYT